MQHLSSDATSYFTLIFENFLSGVWETINLCLMSVEMEVLTSEKYFLWSKLNIYWFRRIANQIFHSIKQRLCCLTLFSRGGGGLSSTWSHDYCCHFYKNMTFWVKPWWQFLFRFHISVEFFFWTKSYIFFFKIWISNYLVLKMMQKSIKTFTHKWKHLRILLQNVCVYKMVMKAF